MPGACWQGVNKSPCVCFSGCCGMETVKLLAGRGCRGLSATSQRHDLSVVGISEDMRVTGDRKQIYLVCLQHKPEAILASPLINYPPLYSTCHFLQQVGLLCFHFLYRVFRVCISNKLFAILNIAIAFSGSFWCCCYVTQYFIWHKLPKLWFHCRNTLNWHINMKLHWKWQLHNFKGHEESYIE